MPVRPHEPSTRMHFHEDPEGTLGMSGLWHGECARPYWDKVTPVLDKLKNWGRF